MSSGNLDQARSLAAHRLFACEQRGWKRPEIIIKPHGLPATTEDENNPHKILIL